MVVRVVVSLAQLMQDSGELCRPSLTAPLTFNVRPHTKHFPPRIHAVFHPNMNPPRIYVDFNEMPRPNEVLLSKGDATVDSAGNLITLAEGNEVSVYSEDCGKDGRPDNLIADGIVVRNEHGGWTSAAKWLLRIDARGVRHESDEHNGYA